jgi:hypothetical protein
MFHRKTEGKDLILLSDPNRRRVSFYIISRPALEVQSGHSHIAKNLVSGSFSIAFPYLIRHITDLSKKKEITNKVKGKVPDKKILCEKKFGNSLTNCCVRLAKSGISG